MNWNILKTETEYLKAITRTLVIFHANEGTPEADELALLLLLVKDYEDKHIQNIWSLKSIGGESYYKTNVYDTEKPRELMDRIIRASSNEDDIIADFFPTNAKF